MRQVNFFGGHSLEGCLVIWTPGGFHGQEERQCAQWLFGIRYRSRLLSRRREAKKHFAQRRPPHPRRDPGVEVRARNCDPRRLVKTGQHIGFQTSRSRWTLLGPLSDKARVKVGRQGDGQESRYLDLGRKLTTQSGASELIQSPFAGCLSSTGQQFSSPYQWRAQ